MKWGHGHDAGRGRWALLDRQFDLVRTDSGDTYLTRWWIVDTPLGGVCVHRMTAPDSRPTVHTHPFSFVSIPIVGGYIEDRLDPLTMKIVTREIALKRRRGWWTNRVRVGLDAHTITKLLRVPTWTLLVCGPNRGTWGFLERMKPGWWLRPDDPPMRTAAELVGPREWRWIHHDDFDAGHYAPERTRR